MAIPTTDRREDNPPSIVFLPLPLVGHLVPMLELAKLLSPSFSITFLTTHNAPLPAIPFPDSFHLHQLPPVPFTPDPSAHGVTTMSHFISAHKSPIKSFLSHLSLTSRIAAVVTEFVTSMVDAANELHLPSFVFFPSSAASLSSIVFPPPFSDSPESSQELVEVAGISPVPRVALPDAMAVPDGYETFTYHARRFGEAHGVIVNTFHGLEPVVLRALLGNDHRILPPVYAVGPLLRQPDGEDGTECVRWLDAQPERSVVFLCFGSMGWMGREQVMEVACGLERSGHRFLWALRGAEDGLPGAFEERMAGRGMVWRGWAPQVRVLGHRAVGGFVTHCGWNSCLEGVWAGVPMMAWPMYAEQRLNAREMVRDMGVAVEVIGIGDGVVGREEVERALRCLMGEADEGRIVRERVRELRDKARTSAGRGGSSREDMERWVEELGLGKMVGLAKSFPM